MKTTRTTVPNNPRLGATYHLTPKNFDQAFYDERTNRNIGWITKEEQAILHASTVGIAGVGGMGGYVAQVLTRAGIGHIKIADTEQFDVSNLNRQFGANLSTIGKSKVLETGRLCRAIADDVFLSIYTQGITPATVADFVAGCDIICDEIEFWAVASRILLHMHMRETDATSFTCSSVGFGTTLTKFNAGSMKMETILEMTFEEAIELQTKIAAGIATPEEIGRAMELMLRLAAPVIPEYCKDTEQYSTVQALLERLKNSVTASIFGTNPLMASGFLANQIILEIINSKSPIAREAAIPPTMPGYVWFDSWLGTIKVVNNQWW